MLGAPIRVTGVGRRIPATMGWWGNPLAELRWPGEFAQLLASSVFRGEGVPRGDGGPVLVLPGFAAGDSSTWLIRNWLRRIGHVAYASGITCNVDCSDRVFGQLDRRLQRIAADAGRRVAIVGHSRGGQLAWALAARRPELVSNVVALGSGLGDPFAISVPLAAAVATVRFYHRAVTDREARQGCLAGACRCDYGRSLRSPLPATVRLTTIRATGDGLMRPEASAVPGAANVDVPGSHIGLAVSAPAYMAVAQALATVAG